MAKKSQNDNCYKIKRTFDTHSLALYNKISDVRFMATDTGMIVCTTNDGDLTVDKRLFPTAGASCLVQVGQKT